MHLTDFPVRVQNIPGEGPSTGRVEIRNDGKWGLVCFNEWSMHDTIVVCREAYLGNNGTAIQISSYSQTDTVWLNDANCTGNESHLSNCSHSGLGFVDQCKDVAGVECFCKTSFNISVDLIMTMVTYVLTCYIANICLHSLVCTLA